MSYPGWTMCSSGSWCILPRGPQGSCKPVPRLARRPLIEATIAAPPSRTTSAKRQGDSKWEKPVSAKICGFLRFPAKICGFQRFSAQICDSQIPWFTERAENQRKSAKICENVRFLPFAVSLLARPAPPATSPSASEGKPSIGKWPYYREKLASGEPLSLEPLYTCNII